MKRELSPPTSDATAHSLPHSRLKATSLLAGIGLASAALTVCFAWFGPALLIVGGIFGLPAALYLQRARILTSQQAGRFVLLSTVAYALAAALAFKLEPLFSYRPNSDRDALIVYLIPGALGGLLMIGGAMWLARRSSDISTLVITAFWGAIWGGALAGAGWALGPSLGTFASTLPNQLFSFLASPQQQDWFSLFIVWEAGMSLMLGLMLGGRGIAKEAA